MKTEFGQIVTRKEQLMYALLQEQRKTNKLLESLVQKPKSEPEKSTRKSARAKEE